MRVKLAVVLSIIVIVIAVVTWVLEGSAKYDDYRRRQTTVTGVTP